MSIITISRGSLSASSMLAEKVSERLNWSVVKREDVLKAAEKYGIKETGLGELSFIEKSPSLLDKMGDRKRQYLICFQTALFDFALQGDFVYNGHLAQFLLTKIPSVVRVMLTAPADLRINNVMKESGKTREEAVAYIKLTDERRQKWSHFLYGVNWKDPAYYDLVFNIERISIDLAADILADVMSTKEFQSGRETEQILGNLHLASLAKVYLQQSPRTRGSDVEIEADSTSGSLLVTGNCPRVGARMWESDIRGVLSKLEGVKEIKIQKLVVGFYE
ncbi:MAG: cytidylate kinase-like family protein [Bacteroidetes bacterium]|nr:cytidylate kinase-like family protein [Bacteroidota bacterium]